MSKRCDDCPNQMACERADVCLHSSGRVPAMQPCPIDPRLAEIMLSGGTVTDAGRGKLNVFPVRLPFQVSVTKDHNENVIDWDAKWEDFPPTV